MFCSAHSGKAGRGLGRARAGWFVVAAMALFGAGQMRAQTVATYGFEDGTAQGWTSFNGASAPVATTNDAYAGTHSLLTTTDASGAGGPAINVGSVLQAGAKYTITGYVKLTPGESASNANFTVRRTDTDGTHYDTIGSYTVAVSASGWAQIGGSYTVSGTETGLTLYAQLVGATSAQSFYLDQVVITQTAPPPGGTPVASWNFSDGGLDGWGPFGSPTLTNVASPVADPAGQCAQPAGLEPVSVVHGAEHQSAGREWDYSGRDVPGDGVRDVAGCRRVESDRFAFDTDGQLREPERKLWNDCDRSGLEHSVDEGAGDVQLQ